MERASEQVDAKGRPLDQADREQRLYDALDRLVNTVQERNRELDEALSGNDLLERENERLEARVFDLEQELRRLTSPLPKQKQWKVAQAFRWSEHDSATDRVAKAIGYTIVFALALALGLVGLAISLYFVGAGVA